MAEKARKIYDSAAWARIDNHLDLPDEERGLPSLDADLMLLTPAQFELLAADGYIFRKPAVLRERRQSAPGDAPSPEQLEAETKAARQLFAQYLRSSAAPPNLSIQDPAQPYGKDAAQWWDKSVVLQELESDLPFNCLSLPDFSGQARPDFFKHQRFRILDDLLEGGGGATRTEDDVDFSRQFGLFAKAQALSGFHCDKLSGTYIQNLAGYKAWAFIIPQPPEKREFKIAGIDWCPAKGRAKILILEPGDILIMPPGIIVAHAPYAITDCTMRGGAFWDSFAIVATLESILETTIENNHTTTNEAVPEQFDAVLRRLSKYACDKDCDFFRTHFAHLREEELETLVRLANDMRNILQKGDLSLPISSHQEEPDMDEMSGAEW